MGAFFAVVAAIFFVLGGIALALPWRGAVAWAERRPASAGEASRRYLLLLLMPVLLSGVFVLSLLGPWDAAVCRQLHDACLDRISGWRLPVELGLPLGLVAVLAFGRLARPYLVAVLARPLPAAALSTALEMKWRAVHDEVLYRCGALPPVFVVRSEAPVCYVRGMLGIRLFVSDGLLETLDHDELVGAMCHEVAHWRRGDLPAGLLAYLCHCLLFFMPTSRPCYLRYLESRELAADDWAVVRTDKPLALAAALAKVGRSAAPAPGAVGYASGGPLLERRLARLLGPPAESLEASPGVLVRLAPAILGLAATGSLMALHLVLEGWGRGLLTTLGVID